MIARWVAALAVVAAFAGAARAEPAQGERPRRLQTFPAYLYLLPPPVIYPFSVAGGPTIP
jgi:hypothetical protein